MADNTLYNIKDVCKMLGTTSRTFTILNSKRKSENDRQTKE